jgi:acetyl esterase
MRASPRTNCACGGKEASFARIWRMTRAGAGPRIAVVPRRGGQRPEAGESVRYRYDPELAAALELQPTASIEDLEAARALQQQLAASAETEIEGTDILEISDRTVPAGSHGPSVRVRVYVPLAYERPLPGVLYIHSGGFVLGSIEGEHARAAWLAASVGAVLVSVEHRLAPEHPYPAALDDCFAALSWMAAGADQLGIASDRVAVAGSSSGACLAAAVALLARDRGGPHLCFQLLNAPVLDDRLETPSMTEFTDTPVWDRRSAMLSWRHYLGERDDTPYYAAPARAGDLSGLPPAYIATGQFDPLRDEGILYGLRLLQAGVAAEIHNFPGAYHGSDFVETAEISQRWAADVSWALRHGLNGWSGDGSRATPLPADPRIAAALAGSTNLDSEGGGS